MHHEASALIPDTIITITITIIIITTIITLTLITTITITKHLNLSACSGTTVTVHQSI